MKITWLSPFGEGWSIAYKLRLMGHKVVVVDFANTGNGDGLVPKGDPKEWPEFARKSDAVVVDANWASRRTRRSYAPSDEVLDLQQLRHQGIKVMGPVPTSELIENDARYQRKVLRRLGIPSSIEEPQAPVVRCTLSRNPFGKTGLVFRYPLSPEVGAQVVQAGDLRVSLNGTEPVVATFLDPLHRLSQSIGYDGYLNVDLVLGSDGYSVVENVVTSPRYPGAFLDLAHVNLLGSGEDAPLFSTAICIFDLPNASHEPDELIVTSRGFYGLNLTGDSNHQGSRCLGAVTCFGDLAEPWDSLQSKVKQELEPWATKGYGFALDIGAGVPEALKSLHKWGYLR